MTMQSFLGEMLSGALTTDSTTWISASGLFPNGYLKKGSIIVQNVSLSTQLLEFGPQGGSLTNRMTTTVYAFVTAFQLEGTDAPDGAEFQLKAVWWRDGATVTEIKAPTVVDSNPNANGTAWTAELSLTPTNGAQIEVTGDNAKTIRWATLLTLYEG